MDSSQIEIPIPDDFDLALLCGPNDSILHCVEDALQARISIAPDKIIATVSKDNISHIESLILDLMELVKQGISPQCEDVLRSIELLLSSNFVPAALRDDILLTYRGRAIRPKTAGQKIYCDAIRNNVITFGIGPAGTGKTYLAMAMAISALKNKEIGRIILTRPVVEAGENLGFLPGSLTEKIDPYIRPLYDALFDLTDAEKGSNLIEQGVIEIAPLAFMRGRTFNDAFLILDEAQNTSSEQMKMFLTRLGFGSKMVITGDLTQIDVRGKLCGLREVTNILNGINDIAFCEFSDSDVVRHNLVARIVKAYDEANLNQEKLDLI